MLFLLGVTVEDPSQIKSDGIRGQLECLLWNTEFLQWGFFFASSWNIVAITVERYF